MEIIKNIGDFANKYGLIITTIFFAIIGLISFIKFLVEKIFENYLVTKKQIKIVNLENEINKKTMAYKMLIENELEFYNKYYLFVSNMIPDIQDVKYNLNNSNCKDFKKYTLKMIEVIPKIKSELLLYESYCDKNVFNAIAELIKILQTEFLVKLDKIISKDEIKGSKNKLDDICDKVLMQIAWISTLICTREKILSGQDLVMKSERTKK